MNTNAKIQFDNHQFDNRQIGPLKTRHSSR
jgi:hypothetical protein